MSDSIRVRSVAYAAIAVVGVGAWAFAQTVVDTHRAKLPIIAYIDCLQKFETIVWPEMPGRIDGPSATPSSSAVCKDLTSRQKAD